ncbi:MAG TPA: HAD-IA family hydrolase [Thermoplasmata archaeon]|nr:HAD-IA family hydrolase [Thermoplasmata archaeon]
MPRLKALTFDLWDTLIQEVPRKNPTLGKVRVKEMRSKLRTLGHDFPIEAMERAYRRSGEYCDEVWARKKDLPVDDHLLFMLNCIDPKLPSELGKKEYETIRGIYVGTLLKHPPVLMEDAAPTLHSLRARGYRIGLISNTGRTPGDILRVILKRLSIDQYFDCMTFSNEVLIRKPKKEIFQHTLKQMHVAPRHSMHIGDDPEADYDGAKGIGMKAVLLDRWKEHDANGETIRSLSDLLEML